MKKVIVGLLLVVLAFTLTGCQKATPTDSLIMKETEVKTAVDGWTVYTNPQFRYELRHPLNWTSYQVTEGGEEVTLYPKVEGLSDGYLGEVKIKGIVNWQNYYSVADYYAKASSYNLYQDSTAQEVLDFKGAQAVLFKGVKNLYASREISVITIDMKDRLIEFQILADSTTAKVILNSLYFYGNKTVEPTE